MDKQRVGMSFSALSDSKKYQQIHKQILFSKKGSDNQKKKNKGKKKKK